MVAFLPFAGGANSKSTIDEYEATDNDPERFAIQMAVNNICSRQQDSVKPSPSYTMILFGHPYNTLFVANRQSLAGCHRAILNEHSPLNYSCQ